MTQPPFFEKITVGDSVVLPYGVGKMNYSKNSNSSPGDFTLLTSHMKRPPFYCSTSLVCKNELFEKFE